VFLQRSQSLPRTLDTAGATFEVREKPAGVLPLKHIFTERRSIITVLPGIVFLQFAAQAVSAMSEAQKVRHPLNESALQGPVTTLRSQQEAH
jgi:hypothetical protein